MTDGGGATKAAGRRVSRLPSSPARAPPHLRSRRAPGGSAGTRAGGGCPPGAAVSGCWRSGPSCGSRLPPPSPRPGTPSATEKRHHSPTAAPGRAGPSRAGVTPVRFSPARLYPSRLSGSTRGLPLSPTAAPVPPDPAVTSAPLRRPPAPSTSLTEPQWRRRRAVRMRLESRAHRWRRAAGERRSDRSPLSLAARSARGAPRGGARDHRVVDCCPAAGRHSAPMRPGVELRLREAAGCNAGSRL